MAHEDRFRTPTSLRRRRDASKVNDVVSAEKKHEKEPPVSSKPATGSRTADSLSLIISLLASVAIMCLMGHIPQRQLRNLSRTPPSPESPFETSRAMRHISTIAERPRWVGSQAMHEALIYIQSEVEALKPIVNQHGLELDFEMTVSGPGSYIVDIANIDLITSYSNITNIVVRLRPSHVPYDSDMSSLLVNAHVDSAVGAPGASDNVCGAGVVLEIIRCLSSSDILKLSRPVIFLFNSAEEPVLVGAHAFVKQHRWVPTIAAHINLESLGPGDTYHLFRLGPHSPWLAEAFARGVSIPSTSVTASDLFELKVIPGETDFRVFSEFEGIPGYDFVLLDNGYVYHTIYDSVDKVDPVGVHHGGVTVLELILELAGKNDAIGKNEAPQAPESTADRFYVAAIKIANRLGLVKDAKRPKVMFFDLIRLKTVVYEEGVAMALHIIVLFVTALIWVAKLTDMGPQGARACLGMIAVIVGVIPAVLSSATFASLVYSEVHKSKLRWYGDWVTAVLMFGPPALFGCVSALLFLLPKRLSTHRYEHMLFAFTFVHFIFAAALMYVGFMSSFVPILFIATANFCALQGEGTHVILRHLQLSLVHAVLGAKLVTTSLASMLPILGRLKSETIPHDTIASLIVSALLLVYLILPCLPLLCHYARSLRVLQMITFLVSVSIGIWLVILQPAREGTPSKNRVYSTDAPKRIIAAHFYSPQQDPMSTVSVSAMDPITMDIDRIFSRSLNGNGLSPHGNELPSWGDMGSTAIETFRPFGAFLQSSTVFTSEHPPSLALPSVEAVSEEELESGWNVSFVARASDSHQLTVRFKVGTNSPVVDWSLNAPMKNDPDGAWVRHVGTTDFQFSVLLRKENQSPRPKLKMVVTSARLGTSRSTALEKLVFTDWEAPVFFVSAGVELIV